MKTVPQLERELIELKKMVKELLRPKSKARVINIGSDGGDGGEDHYLFTLNEDMGESGGGSEIRSMDDLSQIDAAADVKNTLGDFSHMVSGDRGICALVDGVYYALHPEDVGTKAHVFVLTSGLANVIGSTATATVIVSGEDGVSASDVITVYNTGSKLGFAGAEGLCIKIGSEYWVVELNQLPMRIQVVLSADTHTFSGGGTYQGRSADRKTPQVSVSAAVSTTPHPFSFLPDPLTEITNPYNLIGLSGDNGIVTYNQTVGELQLIEVLPQEKLRVRFRLTADMPTTNIVTTTDYVPIESRQFTAGEMPHLPAPPSDAIHDPMQLVVNGIATDEGIIEYSYRDAIWQVTAFMRRDNDLGSLTGVATAVGTQNGGDHDGLEYADLLVFEASNQALIGTTERVWDRKGCILDIDVTGYTVWSHQLWAASMDTAKACDELVKYWAADDRCCDPDTAVYRECGE